MSKWLNIAAKVRAALEGRLQYLPLQAVPGTRIRIPLNAHRAYWSGPMPDADLVAFLAGSLPREGGVFLDIGANIGTYSAAVAAASRGHVRGAAFEPVPTTHALLNRTLALNGLSGFRAEIVALSSKQERLHFTAYGGGGNNFIVSEGDDRGQIVAHSTTLDAWVEAHPGLAPDAVKIDVEGHELEVLKGGRTVLARFRPALVIECHCASWEAQHVSATEVVELLRGCGYPEPVDRRGAPVDLTRCTQTVHILLRSRSAAA
jgi:FkbM family methyltransferase